MQDLPLLRSSERTTWKRCPYKWHWQYNECLFPVRSRASYFWFGAGMHVAAAEYYVPGFKRGADPRETWLKFVDDTIEFVKGTRPVEDEDIDTWEEASELGVLMWENYLNHYGPEEHLEVIQPERIMRGIIKDPVTKKPVVQLVGVTDLIIRNHAQAGRLELWDHKNVKSINTDALDINDQPGGYLLLATKYLQHEGLIGDTEVVRGLMYNFLRKAKPDTRPVNSKGQYLNKDGSVSARQPKPYFQRFWVSKTRKERNNELRAIANEARIMKLQRNGKLPLWKTPKDDCRWDCEFFMMCSLHERGQDWEDYRDRMFKKGDPYEDYRGDRPNFKATLEGYKAKETK